MAKLFPEFYLPAGSTITKHYSNDTTEILFTYSPTLTVTQEINKKSQWLKSGTCVCNKHIRLICISKNEKILVELFRSIDIHPPNWITQPRFSHATLAGPSKPALPVLNSWKPSCFCIWKYTPKRLQIHKNTHTTQAKKRFTPAFKTWGLLTVARLNTVAGSPSGCEIKNSQP